MAEDEGLKATPPEDADDGMLSEAARGVIRQDADPRLDAHLARMLSDAEAVGPRRRGGNEAVEADLAAVRAEIETARQEALAARERIRLLTRLLAVAIVAIVGLIVLVVLR